jgi:inosine-uridine nucleoside N-ribohydrolase
MVRRLILDVDTGGDEAVAIMMAALHPRGVGYAGRRRTLG